MTNMKDDIEGKRNQGIFKIIDEVQMKGLVDEFIFELGKRDDANAQWFAIRWELAKMDKKITRQLAFITIQLFVFSVLGLILTFLLLQTI